MTTRKTIKRDERSSSYVGLWLDEETFNAMEAARKLRGARSRSAFVTTAIRNYLNYIKAIQPLQDQK